MLFSRTQRPAERAASPSVKDKKSEQVSQSAAAEGADNKPTGSESRPLTEKSGETISVHLVQCVSRSCLLFYMLIHIVY